MDNRQVAELVDPQAEYQQSYLAALREFEEHGISGFWNYIAQGETDTAKILQRIHDQEIGKNLPENWVPSSTYWLLAGEQFIGHVNIRHHLNPTLEKRGGHIGYAIRPSQQGRGYGTEILQLALPKAKDLGLKKALLTCYAEHIASKKIIEKAGGQLQDQIEYKGEPILRYWIDMADGRG